VEVDAELLEQSFPQGKFIASWGSEMLVEKGDYLAGYGKPGGAELPEDITEVCRMEKGAFVETYIMEASSPPERSTPAQTSAPPSGSMGTTTTPQAATQKVEPDATFMENARSLFCQLDKNGDGKVTKKELKEAVKKSSDIQIALKMRNFKDCCLFVDNADTDQDGGMSFEEFTAALACLPRSQPVSQNAEVWGSASVPNDTSMDRARSLFSQLDKNGDGKVTKKELKEAMKKSSEIQRALNVRNFSDCRLFLENADTDQDGGMSFEEFMTALSLVRE
jgi:Ca2+-binding EF-hand superfamily protein